MVAIFRDEYDTKELRSILKRLEKATLDLNALGLETYNSGSISIHVKAESPYTNDNIVGYIKGSAEGGDY